MKISGTKAYADVEHNGRTARFWGDLCSYYFAAIASTMEWFPPHENDPITEEERNTLIREVREYCTRTKVKVKVYDDNGKKYKPTNMPNNKWWQKLFNF